MQGREIRFRYRYTDGNNWIFEIFTLDQIINGEPFEVLSDQPLLRNYRMHGQDEWAGLTDKNNQPIYEGDVVAFHYDECDYYGVISMGFRGLSIKVEHEIFFRGEPHQKYRLVKNIHGYFTVRYPEFHDLEILGNIHANPDLLHTSPLTKK